MTPIEQIGNDKLVETIARNMRVTSDYFDDLCQEVYFILITGYTEEKLQEAIDKKRHTMGNYNERKKVYMNSFVTLSSAIKQGYLN